MKYIIVIFLSLQFGNFALAQNPHKPLRSGDTHYYAKEYLEAEAHYGEAFRRDSNSVNANHNLGNVLYQQKRFEESAQRFERAAKQAADPAQRAKSLHNLGNANIAQLEGTPDPQQRQTLVQQGIDAYKQALKINPNDEATKYNLAYAQRLQKMMSPPPQQQKSQKNDNNSDNEPQGENENKENEQPQKQKNKPSSEKQKQEMSKKEAERLLKAMEEEERKVQEKMNKKTKQNPPNGKDW